MPDRADVLVIGSDVTPEDRAAFDDESDDWLRDGLLDPVIDRGPIWRQA
jgi:hypothetical protein